MTGDTVFAARNGIVQLTESQKRCLRLVLAHLTSKQIARELNLSPHTVDAHLKAAIRTLSAANRTEAALMLAEAEGEMASQPLAYQSLAMVNARQSMVFPAHGIAPADDVNYAELVQTKGEHNGNSVHDAFANAEVLNNFLQQNHEKAASKNSDFIIGNNRLPKSYRVVAIFIISIVSILLFSASVSAMQSLSSLYI